MQILFDPGNQVVLERPFDELVEKIWCKKFIDVGTGKVGGKRLLPLSVVCAERLFDIVLTSTRASTPHAVQMVSLLKFRVRNSVCSRHLGSPTPSSSFSGVAKHLEEQYVE